MPRFDPDYASCSYTHVWLRVMHQDLNPDEVTALLRVSPTYVQEAGDPATVKPGYKVRPAGWFLESENHVRSRDCRDHIQWLLDRVAGSAAALRELSSRGYLVDICCRWDSSWGHGGPTMDPAQMSQLGQLGVDFWFDVYFDDCEDSVDP